MQTATLFYYSKLARLNTPQYFPLYQGLLNEINNICK